MNKTQLECFLSAANTGSISAAAKECFLSAQIVSRHIMNLEEELNSTLFFRTKNGVTLTEEGYKLYAYANETYAAYTNALKRIHDYYSSISVSFRIGISEYVDMLGAISSGLHQFRIRHEHVEMSGRQYKNKALLEEVENGNLDVAIINDLQIVAGSSFDYLPFAKEDLRLYIASDQTRQFPKGITMEDLRTLCQEIPHLSTSYGTWDTSDWEEISHRTSMFLGFDFKYHYDMVNFRSCMLNLLALPCSVVCDARFGYMPADQDIFSIPIRSDSYLCVLWHKKNENPLIREFSDFMKEHYQLPVDSEL